MTTGLSSGSAIVAGWQRYLLLAAAVMTCLLVAMGGIVCATESATGCPDWPGCFGRIIPPPQVNAIIEYLHRLIAALTSPLIFAAAAVSWRWSRTMRWVSRPLAIAIVFLIAVIIFGAFAVLRGLPPAIAAIDLGSALVVLALITTSTTVVFAREANPHLLDRLSGQGAYARLSLAALGGVFLVHVSGILVAGKGSLTRCLGWPIWRLLPDDLPGWPQIARLALSVVTAVLVVAVVIQAWRTQRGQAALLKVATILGLLFVVEMAVGVLMQAGNSSVVLAVVHVAAAAAAWALLVALATLAGLASAAQARSADAGARFVARRSMSGSS